MSAFGVATKNALALDATAEDALYEWLDRQEPDALPAGIAFYERLLAKSDAELA
jgi:hypothetical protein